MRRLSPDASSPWSVGRSDERCERNVHSTYFHTKPSVSERLYGLRYHLRPLFHLYITHISQSHDPRNRLPQGSDRATDTHLFHGAPVMACTLIALMYDDENFRTPAHTTKHASKTQVTAQKVWLLTL